MSYTFPAGIDVKSMFRLLCPQIAIGGIFHSDLNPLRFLAYNFGGEFGKLQLLGVALRHDVGHYFNINKYYVNAGFSFQSIKLGSRIYVTNNLISLDGGQDFKYFYYFGKIGYQFGNMDVNYTTDPDEGGEKVEFNINNDFL
ncbi:MAG: hypothetical protein IPI30_22670 [Saprospiraceae bacterium]|nr:hypothetical protein [Candidatus Vicinibacter affinis]